MMNNKHKFSPLAALGSGTICFTIFGGTLSPLIMGELFQPNPPVFTPMDRGTEYSVSYLSTLSEISPSETNEQIETMVVQTSDPIIYSINPDNNLAGKLGKGRVDALAAIATPLFPKIEFADIDLTINGNDNNYIEVGESIELSTILLNNPDWGYAENVVGVLELHESDNAIIITQNTSQFGDASPGDALINWQPFIIQFTDDSEPGDIEFKLNIHSNTDFNGYIQNNQVLTFIITLSDEIYIPGDVNQDEIINILDIVQLVNIILGNAPSNSEINAGDLNNDEIINVLDIILIVNIILNS